MQINPTAGLFGYTSPTIKTPIHTTDLTDKLNIISAQSLIGGGEVLKLVKSHVGARVPLEFELGWIEPRDRVVEKTSVIVGPELEAGDGELQEAMGKQLCPAGHSSMAPDGHGTCV